MKLFSQTQGGATEEGLPFILPNLALIGDKVRNFAIKFTPTPWIQVHKHHINVPSYVSTKDNVHRQAMIRGALWRVKLFYTMKFKGAKETVYLAQLLLSYRMAESHMKRTLNAMGWNLTWKNKRVIDEAIENDIATAKQLKIDELSRTPMLPQGDVNDFYVKVTREVQKLYETGSIEQFVRDLILLTAPVSISYTSSMVREYVASVVKKNLPFDTSDYIIELDVSVITRAIYTAHQAVLDAQSYARYLDLTDNIYKEYIDYNGETRNKWVYKVIADKKLRYRVNKLVRLLEMREPNSYSKTQYSRLKKQLPSSEQAIAEEQTLVLPKQLDPKLSEEIIQEAERNYESYLVDYESNMGGVHGKAKTYPFKPNKAVHKAIRELAKHNSDRGVVPKHMHRMTTDKKVFSRRKTVAGGSMMIDCSGSMAMTPNDVEEIVNLLPASNIAGYVGYNHKEDGYDGMIRIIAKDGRMDTNSFDDLDQYGANSVDMEALKWLASMPEPRIWVSDQMAIGVDEESGRNKSLATEKLLEISNFMRRNNIIPIEDTSLVKQVAKQLSLKR